jgi:2-alkenal reductase
LRGIDPQTGTIGDVIVAADDRSVRRLADLTAALEKTGIGGSVELTIERSGRTGTVKVDVADVGRAAR